MGEGARGEFGVGEELEKLHRYGFHIFHDWYSGRGNVDHFVVGPQGVFAFETKAWTGEISCKNKEILRNGERPVGKNPIKQAKGEAGDVNKLTGKSRGLNLWVSTVLCFSRAELHCYGVVDGGQLTDSGALRRTIVEQPEYYSSQRLNSISYALEKHLSLAPAAKPGIPPPKPGRLKEKLKPERVFVALSLVSLLALTLVFADSTATLFQGVATYTASWSRYGACSFKGSKHRGARVCRERS